MLGVRLQLRMCILFPIFTYGYIHMRIFTHPDIYACVCVDMYMCGCGWFKIAVVDVHVCTHILHKLHVCYCHTFVQWGARIHHHDGMNANQRILSVVAFSCICTCGPVCLSLFVCLCIYVYIYIYIYIHTYIHTYINIP
jgi:hypothetical protein